MTLNAENAVVCDIDGTLCDVSSIRHLVDPASGRRDFEQFHDRSIECPANDEVRRVLDLSRQLGHRILLVTGRQERWSFMTLLWLHERDIAYDDLLMRGSNDGRPDKDVKTSILRFVSQHYRVALAVDDNPETVAVWRSAGIPTITVGPSGSLESLTYSDEEKLGAPLIRRLWEEFPLLRPSTN